jgi:hypothetical protein
VSSIAFAFRLRNTPDRVVDLGLGHEVFALGARRGAGEQPGVDRAPAERLEWSLLFCMRTLVGQRSADTA